MPWSPAPLGRTRQCGPAVVVYPAGGARGAICPPRQGRPAAEGTTQRRQGFTQSQAAIRLPSPQANPAESLFLTLALL